MNITNKPYLTRKFIATIIDYSILTVLSFFYIKEFGEPNGSGAYQVEGLDALPPILFWLLLFPIAESIFSATLGHFIVGLKVIDVGGSKPDFIQTLKRRLADIVDLVFYGIPAMIAIKKTEKNQRLGDLWAETMVVCRKEKIEII
nr:RDD family protein [uncultured Draconibacterium sp.]